LPRKEKRWTPGFTILERKRGRGKEESGEPPWGEKEGRKAGTWCLSAMEKGEGKEKEGKRVAPIYVN